MENCYLDRPDHSGLPLAEWEGERRRRFRLL